MRTIGGRTLRVLTCAVLAMTFAVAGAASAGADDSYLVATDPNHPPFAYLTPDDRLVGVDVDILNAIASEQSFDVTFLQLPFDEAVHAARDGRVDAVMSAAPITPMPNLDLAVSDPYFEFGSQMAVPDTSTDIWSYEDLAGKRVAVTAGSSSAEFADSIRDRYDFTITTAPDAESMYDAVRSGSAQAVFDDWAAVNFGIAGGNGFMTVTPRESGGGGAALLVASHVDTGFVERFNAGLEELERTGMYDKILTRYLGGRDIVGPQASDTSGPGAGLVGELLTKLWVPIFVVVLLGLAFAVYRVVRGIRAASTPQSVYPPPPPMPAPPPAHVYDAPPVRDDDPEARIRQLEQSAGGGYELGTDTSSR